MNPPPKIPPTPYDAKIAAAINRQRMYRGNQFAIERLAAEIQELTLQRNAWLAKETK